MAPQAETLWDDVLPIEVKQLPESLARIDELLQDAALLLPIAERRRAEVAECGRAVPSDGRPTTPMETYVRLMVVKQRTRRGYETLVREVSDSIHLRRFCLIPTRTGSLRVDDPQADPPSGRRHGRGTDQGAGRQGDAGAPPPALRRADRLDRGGARPLPRGGQAAAGDLAHPRPAGAASAAPRSCA